MDRTCNYRKAHQYISSTTKITTHDSTIKGISQNQTKCYVNMSKILTIINYVYENLVEKLERQ